MRSSRFSDQSQRGFTLIEVMVAVMILAVGLLGLAGLQARLLNGQFEAYQRAQAMMLLEDMASRIRSHSVEGRSGSFGGQELGGSAMDCDEDAATNSVSNELACWNEALRGASVTNGEQLLGSMIGARGCIEDRGNGGSDERVIRVIVAWQGVTPTVASSFTCGEGAYGDDERLHRAVAVDVSLAYLGD